MVRPAWIVGGLTLLAACAGAPSQQVRHAAEAFERDPCVVPQPKSAIASDVRFDGDSAFRGRVLTVTGEAVPHSMLILEPGGHGALADSLGRFQFEGVPRGRYLLRVLNIGYMSVEDSVTYSEWGVEVHVALAISRLDLLACVRAAEPPDSSAAVRRSTDLAQTGSIRGRVTDDEGGARFALRSWSSSSRIHTSVNSFAHLQ